jgi:hypothetical protein
MSADYQRELAMSFFFYENDKTNQTAIQMIANGCAAAHYDASSIACAVFRTNITQAQSTIKDGYRFWPLSGPFLEYGLGFPLDYVTSEVIINSDFPIGRVVNFQFGRFSKTGTFIGFTPFMLDFQKCGEKNDIANKWRIFGSNFYRQCLIDLSELVNSETTDFFDPFIEDTIV